MLTIDVHKRSEIKEVVILLAYAGLLNETLTKITVLFVIIGAVLVWLSIRPGKLTRNILTLAVFGSYWIFYGKVIDPEVGLNFLTIIIVLKLLEKETERDRYMIFFGIMLLISAGTLFERNLIYVLFFALSFLMLIEDFYGNLRLPFRLQEMAKILIWILPLTVILFFFAPRAMNPLAMDGPHPSKGEVGYTPEVNISEVESLTLNNSPVFQAEIAQIFPPEKLYWRANTLSFTDGWNWPIMPRDRVIVTPQEIIQGSSKGIEQSIRILSRQDFLFTLDHPLAIQAGKKSMPLGGNKTVALARHQWYSKYHVKSGLLEYFESTEENLRPYLYSSLPLEQVKWIKENFTSETYPALIDEIRSFLISEGFTYSLSPGKITSFQSFILNKKTGFCSHYASAVALILRAKGIPSRLVSGFMGGTYNQYAGFYLIGQNDAHVWVEALYNGNWRRIDPTGWVAPERVRLGGEAFLALGSKSGKRMSWRPAWASDAQQWFAQWDYRFYKWLEEMDYEGQEALFQRINFNRQWLYSVVPVLLALFMGLYTWHLSNRKKLVSETGALWLSLRDRLHIQGIELQLVSLGQDLEVIKNSDHKKKEEILLIWKRLVDLTFNDKGKIEARDLQKRIKKI